LAKLEQAAVSELAASKPLTSRPKREVTIESVNPHKVYIAQAQAQAQAQQSNPINGEQSKPKRNRKRSAGTLTSANKGDNQKHATAPTKKVRGRKPSKTKPVDSLMGGGSPSETAADLSTTTPLSKHWLLDVTEEVEVGGHQKKHGRGRPNQQSQRGQHQQQQQLLPQQGRISLASAGLVWDDDCFTDCSSGEWDREVTGSSVLF
jgi:hypothetical protein